MISESASGVSVEDEPSSEDDDEAGEGTASVSVDDGGDRPGGAERE